MRVVSCGSILALLLCTAPVFADDLTPFTMPIKPEQRRHWAFQPLNRPAIPTVHDSSWVRSPIDAFILAKLEELLAGNLLLPVDRRAYLRRLYLDLTGLPPTPQEMDNFLADQSPTAISSCVDDLLARPGYGERWGRHWLDLVRYAETNGYERDAIKPSAWQHRDYVLRSFNADKPYDRFILEQLAGDELPDADMESMLGLGFTRLGPWDDEPADPLEDRFDQLDDMVSTTSQAFLGMTLGCARCHNHKFEPLSQLDYYQMVAIFYPLQRPPGFRQDLDAPSPIRQRRGKLEAFQQRSPCFLRLEDCLRLHYRHLAPECAPRRIYPHPRGDREAGRDTSAHSWQGRSPWTGGKPRHSPGAMHRPAEIPGFRSPHLATAPDPGTVDRRQSAGGARDRQSNLAISLW